MCICMHIIIYIYIYIYTYIYIYIYACIERERRRRKFFQAVRFHLGMVRCNSHVCLCEASLGFQPTYVLPCVVLRLVNPTVIVGQVLSESPRS